MNGIIGMGEVLDNSKDELNPELVQCLETIQECSASLLKMIENIIQYAQLSSSVYKPIYQSCNIREVLHDFIAFYLHSNKTQAVTIKYNVSPQVLNIINTDKRILLKIIARLLDNAIHFSPPNNQVHISVSSKILSNNQFMLLFDIIDTGEGFPTGLFKNL